MKIKVLLLIISFLSLSILQSSDGTLNTTGFNTAASDITLGGSIQGMWYIQTGGSYNGNQFCKAVTLQGTKYLAVGSYRRIGESVLRGSLLRIQSSGHFIDGTFGSSGQVTVAFADGNNSFNSLVVQPIDSKIIVGGNLVLTTNGITCFVVARMTTTGADDTTFNNGGSAPYGNTIPGYWLITPAGVFTSDSACQTVGLQGDNIIAAGYLGIGGITKFAVLRLTSSGVLDTTFAANSTVPGIWYAGGTSDDQTYLQSDTAVLGNRAVLIQSDGKIIIAGRFHTSSPDLYCAGIMRLNSNGTLDTTFNPSGSGTFGGSVPGFFVLSGAFGSDFSDGSAYSVTQDSDGNYIVAGNINYFKLQCPFVMRVTGDGDLDTTFNSGGQPGGYGGEDSGFWILTGYGSSIFGSGGYATQASIDSCGRIVFTATSAVSGSNKIIAIRLTPAGKLDTTFNPSPGTGNPYGGSIPGIWYFSTNNTGAFSGTNHVSSGLYIPRNNQVLLACSPQTSTTNRFSLVSLISKNGLLQDTADPFNTGSAGLILTTTIDQNNKLLAGGNYGTNSQLTRYNLTGSPRNTSFSGDGVALGNLTATAAINKVINNGTGYLVAGVSNTNQFTTASFASDGTLNSGYGTSGIVRETSLGASAAYDMLLNGAALAVSGFTNTNSPSVVNYNSSTGAHNTSFGPNGLQQFPSLGIGTIYGISFSTGTKRYGAGQGGVSNNTAFVSLLVNETGLLQDTAAPFNGTDPGLIYSTTLTQTGNIVAAVVFDSTWQVVSYTSGGVRTPGFGTSGIAEAPGFSGSARPRAIAVDSTGRIIAAGTSVVSTYPVFTVVRYLADGTVDEVVQETSLTTETTPETSALGILVNDDDSITVAGNIVVDGQPVPIIIDYDSNMVQTNVRQFDALAPGYFFGVQTTDDKEYAAGASEDTALLFPLLDGTGLLQDTEAPFDEDHSGRIYSGCIDENDIITLCGNFNNTWMVVQYTGVGERSIGFNSDGVVLESSLGTANAYAIIQDSSGNFYVAGESTVSGTTVLTVAKYNSAGALVTTFGTNGIIQETRFGQSRAFNLVLNPNGSLLIAGQITVNGTLYAALLAYDISGQPITSFGVNGAQTYQAFGAGALYATTVNARYVATSAGQTGDVATLVQTSQDATADAYIHSGL